jgi:AraC-like DNA-binding protein
MIIENNIDNYELDVSFLCQQLHITQAQLHKKTTYLTGLSTTKFIKKIRLQKAEELLNNLELNITEIAYKTGFDVKYFSKMFKQTYGLSPSDYRKTLKD